MKKKIEIQINKEHSQNGEERIRNIVRSISKRVPIILPKDEDYKKEEDKYSVVIEITQEQFDALPIGLRKLLE